MKHQHSTWVSLVAKMVKNLPVMQETKVRFPGQEDPLEKRMATHSSILAWRIPWTEEPGGLQSMGWKRVRHNRATHTHTHTHTQYTARTVNAHCHYHNMPSIRICWTPTSRTYRAEKTAFQADQSGLFFPFLLKGRPNTPLLFPLLL